MEYGVSSRLPQGFQESGILKGPCGAFGGEQATSNPVKAPGSCWDSLSSPCVVGAATPDHDTLIHCLLVMLVVFKVKLQSKGETADRLPVSSKQVKLHLRSTDLTPLAPAWFGRVAEGEGAWAA